jgi:quercetin dioxygenase-like cupin family protein
MTILNTVTKTFLCYTLLMGSIHHCHFVCGQAFPDTIPVAEPFPVDWLYNDSSGATHFSEKSISFALADFAPPAPSISISELIQTNQETFLISSPAGWYGHWHPVPRRQLMVVLQGQLEVEVSDGEIRTFYQGNAILVEDTVGTGHISRVTGNKRCYMLVIPLLIDK